MRVEIRPTRRGFANRRAQNNKNSKKQRTGPVKKPGMESSSPSRQQERFTSVLTEPFNLWNRIEDIIVEFLPTWSPSQRSSIIENVIRFLELKIIMEEYETNHLLSPTLLVAHAWHVLILETELYLDVTYAIQDFHARPHRMIHHALLRRSDKKGYEERLERTQRLFKSYYNLEMPTSVDDIEGIPCIQHPSWMKRTQSNDASIVSTRDEGTISWDEGDEKTLEEEGWGGSSYFPWLASCNCFLSVFGDELCSREETGDIYAVREDVSLLTPPGSLPDEPDEED